MTFSDVLRNDTRLIRRNAIMYGMFIFIVYIGTVLRFALPWLNNYLAGEGIMPGLHNSHPFSEYFPLIIANLIIYTGPNIVGAVFAFIILGEKDEDTLRALLVSPLSPKQYLNFRMILTFAVTLLTVAALFLFVNLAVPGVFALIAALIGAGQTGVIILLCLIIFSDGKVQGMNYSKFISFFGYLLIASWWVREPLQFLFGIFPPYWITKAYWSAIEGDNIWWLYFAIGVFYQGALLYLLRKLYIKRIYLGM